MCDYDSMLISMKFLLDNLGHANTLQRSPYIVDTIGELHVGRYRGPAVAEGFYKYYMNEIRT